MSVLLQKLSNVNKTWMLLGPRYRRMGGGDLLRILKARPLLNKDVNRRGGGGG